MLSCLLAAAARARALLVKNGCTGAMHAGSEQLSSLHGPIISTTSLPTVSSHVRSINPGHAKICLLALPSLRSGEGPALHKEPVSSKGFGWPKSNDSDWNWNLPTNTGYLPGPQQYAT